MLRSVDGWDGEHFGFGEADASPADVPTSVAIDNGADGPSATIPDAHLLFTAQFARAGADLVLHGEDGKAVVVQDYFAADQRARLLSPDGAALSPEIVEALAGPLAPGQFAQAAATPPAAQAVGRVAVVTGDATIVRNGVAMAANAGDPILKGDVLQTVSGTIGVTFSDGSTLNLTANTRLVVNEFVYDPRGSANSQLLDLVQGSLTFISGEIAHNGDMRIGTPVATMGIRGTVGGVTTANDGTVNFYVSQSATGAVILDSRGTIIANVVQDGPLIIVRPVGPLQVIAEEVQKSPAQLATELAALQQIVNIQSVGQQIIQQYFQPDPNNPNPNPNPQSTDKPLTQIQIFQTPSSEPPTGEGGTNDAPPAPFNAATITTTTPNPDGTQTTQTETVTFVPNVAPILNYFNLVVAEGGIKVLSGSDYSITDPDSSSFTFSVAGVSGGVFQIWSEGGASNSGFAALVAADAEDGYWTDSTSFTAADIAAGHVRFVHDGSNGAPIFSISVSDGIAIGQTITSTVVYTAVNEAPVAPAISVTTDENGAPVTINGLANASDAEGDSLHIENAVLTITDAQGHALPQAAYTVNGNSITVDPAQFNYLGAGEQAILVANYNVVDSHGASVATSATLTVNGVNDAPEAAAPVTATASEDVAVIAIVLTGTDIDGTLASFRIVVLPEHGTLYADAGLTTTLASNGTVTATGNAATVYFVPDEDWSGSTSLQFAAVDYEGGEDLTPARAVIDVAPVADIPQISSDFVSPTPIAAGEEFRVNSTAANDQYMPSVAALADGGFVVTWMSMGQDGNVWDVYGQRYGSNGEANGSEFQINSFVMGEQSYPSVTGLAGGGFVVAWMSSEQDGSDGGVYGQRFDASGTVLGDEFRISTQIASHQGVPSVAALEGGGFVITWASLYQDGDGYGIYGQKFAADGTVVGSEFRINTYVTNQQLYPSVSGLGDGFVVIWVSEFQDGSFRGVYGQQFDAVGAPIGGEFQVNTYSDNVQTYPSVAELKDGGFIVTWMSDGQDGSDSGVYGQRYDASGAAAGSEFKISTYSVSAQNNPTVTGIDDGGFLVTWSSFGQDGSDFGVYGQRYDAAGAAVGDEFRLNETTAGWQIYEGVGGGSGVATLANGQIVQVWYGNGVDQVSGHEVYARLFDLPSSHLEDAPISLPFTVNFGTDNDGSETHSLVLSGLPEGFTATAGQHQAVSDGEGIDVTGWNLADLVVTPAEGWNGTFTAILTAATTDIATLSDGAHSDMASASRSVTVIVTPVNDAPTAAISPTSYNASEQTALTLKGSGLAISDVDAASGSMTVTLSVTAGILNASAGDSGASVSGDGTSSLTITGTVAQINALLAAGGTGTLSYINNSDSPAATATLSLQVVDNGNTGGGDLTGSDTATINIAAVNDAPVMSNTAAPGFAYYENGAAIAIDASLTLIDVDSPMLAGATVTISQGLQAAGDVLGFIAQNGISGTYANGVLTLTGTAGVAAYQAALRSVTYSNTSDNPSGGSRTFSFQVDDGSASGNLSNVITTTAAVMPVNDAPAIAGSNPTVEYTENEAPAVIDSDLTLSDVDSPTLAGATVTISGNFKTGEDVLSFTSPNGSGITGVFASGVLTLSGTASVAAYEAALQSVSYSNSSGSPSADTRTISFSVNDGSTVNNISNTTTATVTVTPLNAAPMLMLSHTETVADGFNAPIPAYDSSSGSVNWTSNWVETNDNNSGSDNSPFGGDISLVTDQNSGSPALKLTDLDSERGGADTIERSFNLSGASAATLTFDYRRDIASGDSLDQFNVYIVSNGSTALIGQIGATGNGSFVDSSYQSFSYNLFSHISSNVVLRFSVGDDVDNGDIVYVDNVKITYTAPATNYAISYVENAAPIAISAAANVITDLDDTHLQSATITIVNVQGGDILSVNGQLPNGITASSYDPQNGVLMLEGNATLADYQAALSQIQFSNTSDNPNGTDRTLTVTVSDGIASSNASTVTVSVTPLNDAPVNIVPAAIEATEDTDTAITGLQVADPDSGANEIRTTLSVSHGVLTVGSVSGGATVTDSGTSTVMLVGTVAEINATLAALSNVMYRGAQNYNAADTLSMLTEDHGYSGAIGGLEGSDVDAVAITVAPVNDAPDGTDNTAAGTEDQPYVFRSSDFAFRDNNDNPSNDFIAVVITTLPAAGLLTLNGVAVQAGESISVANIDSDLLVFTPAPNANGNSYGTFTFQVQDDGGTGNNGVDLDPVPNTFRWDVIAVNDAPVADLNGSDPGTGYETTVTADDTASPVFSSDVSVSDADGDLIQAAYVNLNYVGGGDHYNESTTWTETFSIDMNSLSDVSFDEQTQKYTVNEFSGLEWYPTSGSNGLNFTILGSADAATYAELLAALRFSSHSENLIDRIATVQLDDGENTGNFATATIHFDTAGPGELVGNGSFEHFLEYDTLTIGNWTVGGDTDGETFALDSVETGSPLIGEYNVLLGGIESDVTLRQDISTEEGTGYTLGFWLMNDGDFVNGFTVQWNGETLLSLVDTCSDEDYVHYIYDVVGADADHSTLAFAAFNPFGWWHLDNVSVREGTSAALQEVTSGSVYFTEGSPEDTQSVTATQQDGDAFHFGTFTANIANEPNGQTPGSVAWHFSMTNAEFAELGGEPVTQHYDVTITDNNENSTTQVVTVSIGGPGDDSFTFASGDMFGANTIVNFNKTADMIEFYGFDLEDLALSSTGDDATHGDAVITLGQDGSVVISGITQDYLQQHFDSLVHLNEFT